MHKQAALPARISSAVASIVCLFASQSGSAQEVDLDIAEYSEQGELLFPTDTTTWVHLGSSLGADYSTEEFSPENPGVLGVVQMEPTAFEHLEEHAEYADGTMFLLSFYAASAASEPELRGFVQGELLQQEIHVIDRVRFGAEGRAFFVFRPSTDRARAIPPGSDCVVCHSEHGAWDGTFTQFYPAVRDLVPD